MESASRVLLGSQSEKFIKFPCPSTSSTPIRVDTIEAGHIHVLLPTLEYSMPVSSPAAPGLTNWALQSLYSLLIGSKFVPWIILAIFMYF